MEINTSRKHQWLVLHSLDSVDTVRRLVAFYVDQHYRALPHSAFHGQTPDEMTSARGKRTGRPAATCGSAPDSR